MASKNSVGTYEPTDVRTLVLDVLAKVRAHNLAEKNLGEDGQPYVSFFLWNAILDTGVKLSDLVSAYFPEFCDEDLGTKDGKIAFSTALTDEIPEIGLSFAAKQPVIYLRKVAKNGPVTRAPIDAKAAMRALMGK